MMEEWLGGTLLACGAAIASTSPGTQNQQNERCASGRPLIQLPGPGGDAELGPLALKTSTTDLEQTKEKQFHPEFKYTEGLHLRSKSKMSKALLILATGQDGKCRRGSLPMNGSYPREVCSELANTEKRLNDRYAQLQMTALSLLHHQSIIKSQISFPSTEFNYFSPFPQLPL